MSTEVKQEGTFKVKLKKPKQLTKSDEPIKVDLSKPKTETDAIQEPEATKVDVGEQAGNGKTMGSGGSDIPVINVKEEPEESTEEKAIIEEIIDEKQEVQEIGEKTPELIAVKEDTAIQQKNIEIPENIEKVIDFMKETGGTLDDYVRLNADYSNVDNDTLLREYYKQAKSHLDSEEINFMIEDNFSYDEEADEEREVRQKKLAYKEEVAKAKQHLEGLKSDYYKEIKLRPGVTQDQKKATDFFNRYNEDQTVAQQHHEDFKSNTNKYFSEEFKGFDFSVGEKKFRYGVKNPSEVADKQSDIANVVKKFLNNDGSVKDVKGYHKAMYAAEHADTIAQHFYEQGKTDAVREVVTKSKNVQTDIRTGAPDVSLGGFKVKALSGMDSSKLKIKKKTFNN